MMDKQEVTHTSNRVRPATPAAARLDTRYGCWASQYGYEIQVGSKSDQMGGNTPVGTSFKEFRAEAQAHAWGARESRALKAEADQAWELSRLARAMVEYTDSSKEEKRYDEGVGLRKIEEIEEWLSR